MARAANGSARFRPRDLERVRSALFACDPGCCRDDWAKLGMAAKAAGATVDDFTDWSRNAANFESEKDCRDAWRSFKSGQVTEAWLFRCAIDSGWKDPDREDRPFSQNGNGHAKAPEQPQAAHKAAGEPRPSSIDAEAVWATAEPAAMGHPYIAKKLGLPTGLRVYRGPLKIAGEPIDGALLVPAYDGAGVLQTWQAIPQAGRKLNAPGRQVSGSFPLPGNGHTVYVCEGIGQAWSAHQATNCTAVCAFGVGNLGKAAAAIKAATPNARIVLVADVGVETKVESMAKELGVGWIAPPADLGDKADINDLFKRDGPQAVADLLEQAIDTTPARRFKFLTVAELRRTPPQVWRVLRVIPARGFIVLWGAPGSGKTFTVLDLSCAIARGMPWAGRRTKPGTVAYIAAEGQMRNRIEAYLTHHELTEDDLSGLRVLDSSVNLLDDAADVQPLLADLRALAQETGGIALVVVDTLNRVMPGGDENSSEDIGRVIAVAKLIEKELGCAVLFVHHSGKDEARGGRGHSSLKAATDAEISVKRDGDLRTVTAEKIRDGADGEILLTFNLELVDLGPMTAHDPEAEELERCTSCIVAPRQSKPHAGPVARLSDVDQIALSTMQDLCSRTSDRTALTSVHPAGLPRVAIESWRDQFRLVRGIPRDDPTALDSSRKAFQRSLDRLVNRNLVGVMESKAWLW